MAHARASIGTVDYAATITTGHHKLSADEGPGLGGKSSRPAPYRREGDKPHINRLLAIEGGLDDEQKKRMAEVAERTPVTLTLKAGLEIRTKLN